MSPEAIADLSRMLSGMAMYNDKGYIWYRHTNEEIETTRSGFRASIERFIASVGEANIPTQVLVELRSPELEADGNGIYRERIQSLLRSS